MQEVVQVVTGGVGSIRQARLDEQARARLGVAKNPILVPRVSILLVSVVDP